MEFADQSTKEAFEMVPSVSQPIYVQGIKGSHGIYKGELVNIPLLVAETMDKQGCTHLLRRKKTTAPPSGKAKQD